MLDLTHWSQRTTLLYPLGFIYGLSLAAILLWTTGFVLVFIASQADKPTQEHDARLKRAFHWDSAFVPTPQTFHIASSMMLVYCFSFFAMALMLPYTLEESWAGWVFVEHTIAILIALLATSAIVVSWLRHLPKGQTWPEACYRCFSRMAGLK